MSDYRFKQSLKNEMDNRINHMNNYFNMLTSPEKYDDRVFYLTMSSEHTIEELNILFPENKKEIRLTILNKIREYLMTKLNLSNFLLDIEPDSDNYEIHLYHKNDLWMIISLLNRNVKIILPEDIEYAESVLLPKLETETAKIADAIQQEVLKTREENITEVKQYAKKMFFPKQYDKQIRENIEYLQNKINELKNEAENLYNTVLYPYYNNDEYKTKRMLADSIESILKVRGAGHEG